MNSRLWNKELKRAFFTTNFSLESSFRLATQLPNSCETTKQEIYHLKEKEIKDYCE